jgi:hypothetical protein
MQNNIGVNDKETVIILGIKEDEAGGQEEKDPRFGIPSVYIAG